MATNIQHKLYNLEVPPPPDVWPEIAVRLNREFNAEEVAAAQKMHDLSIAPPAAVWKNIEAELELEQQQPVKKPARIFHLPVYKAASAAAAMVLVTLAAWYFLNNSTNPETANATVVKQSSTTATTENNTNTQKPVPPSSYETVQDKDLAGKAMASASVGNIADRYTSHQGGHRIAWYSDYQPIATSYAGVDDVQAVPLANSTTTPTVEAPLIRDANGKIILDKKLITSPDDCYINITGPNGDQTRISSKFLHYISSLNDDDAPEDYFDFMLQDNSLWKLRFREWKDKLLQDASTNFDILDLKDILQQDNQ